MVFLEIFERIICNVTCSNFVYESFNFPLFDLFPTRKIPTGSLSDDNLSRFPNIFWMRLYFLQALFQRLKRICLSISLNKNYQIMAELTKPNRPGLIDYESSNQSKSGNVPVIFYLKAKENVSIASRPTHKNVYILAPTKNFGSLRL